MGISLPKGWVRGDVTLHVHLTLDTQEGPELCFQYQHADPELNRSAVHVSDARDRHTVSDSPNPEPRIGPRLHDGNDEFSVLVRVRESLKEPHSGALLRAAVRLIPADQCEFLVRDSWQPLGTFIVEGCPRPTHREGNVGLLSGAQSLPRLTNESPSGVIEAGPVGVDNVANDERAVTGNGWDTRYTHGQLLRCIDVTLDRDGVSLGIERLPEGLLQSLEVLIAPSQLLPRASEDAHGA